MNNKKKIRLKRGILPTHPPVSTNASNTSALRNLESMLILTQLHTYRRRTQQDLISHYGESSSAVLKQLICICHWCCWHGNRRPNLVLSCQHPEMTAPSFPWLSVCKTRTPCSPATTLQHGRANRFQLLISGAQRSSLLQRSTPCTQSCASLVHRVVCVRPQPPVAYFCSSRWVSVPGSPFLSSTPCCC